MLSSWCVRAFQICKTEKLYPMWQDGCLSQEGPLLPLEVLTCVQVADTNTSARRETHIQKIKCESCWYCFSVIHVRYGNCNSSAHKLLAPHLDIALLIHDEPEWHSSQQIL